MQTLMPVFVILPLLGFFASLFFNRTQERALSTLALSAVGVQFTLLLLATFFWWQADYAGQHLNWITLFAHEGFKFVLAFYFDGITATFTLVGAVVAWLVLLFSRTYMHRDEGFQRYFSIMLLFYTGFNFAIFAGNFETLFIGWEIIGFTSFLLIGYYRDRYLPVKNAFKVMSLYRFGDVALVFSMWMAHHIFHTNVTFAQLNSPDWLATFHVNAQSGGLLFVAITLLLAAAIKSAQFPFSSWLPRAMEGPTTSSALFYGALSAHLGVFMLLRTAPLWQVIPNFAVAIIVLGAITTATAALTAKVQSTVKTQIAYGAVTQIGIMLIEIGLGLHTLALIHFSGHAFLRTYQLLVSPSTLGYMIHNQFFEYQAKIVNPQALQNRFKNTLYLLGMKEWGLDRFQFQYLWQPFKWLGHRLAWMQCLWVQGLIKALIAFGILLELDYLSASAVLSAMLPEFYALLSLMCILFAFSWRGNPIQAWWMIVMSQILIVLAVSLNTMVEVAHVWIYLTTTIASAALGMFCLHNTYHLDHDIQLNRYHGYVQERPDLALIFLICTMALVGFPFTPTFIAIDLMLTQIHDHQYVLVALTGLGFIFLELAALRIYMRVYLGQHKKHTHPIAYRSS